MKLAIIEAKLTHSIKTRNRYKFLCGCAAVRKLNILGKYRGVVKIPHSVICAGYRSPVR